MSIFYECTQQKLFWRKIIYLAEFTRRGLLDSVKADDDATWNEQRQLKQGKFKHVVETGQLSKRKDICAYLVLQN